MVLVFLSFSLSSILKSEIIDKINIEGNNRISSETIEMFAGVTINDDLLVASKLSVSEATLLGSNLSVAKSVSLNSDLNVVSATKLSSSLSVAKNTNLDGTLIVAVLPQ